MEKSERWKKDRRKIAAMILSGMLGTRAHQEVFLQIQKENNLPLTTDLLMVRTAITYTDLLLEELDK